MSDIIQLMILQKPTVTLFETCLGLYTCEHAIFTEVTIVTQKGTAQAIHLQQIYGHLCIDIRIDNVNDRQIDSKHMKNGVDDDDDDNDEK